MLIYTKTAVSIQSLPRKFQRIARLGLLVLTLACTGATEVGAGCVHGQCKIGHREITNLHAREALVSMECLRTPQDFPNAASP